MSDIDPAELDRLTKRIAELEEQLAKAHNCATCGVPLSYDCPECKRAWES